MRLRLKVENNTLPSGGKTRITAEFLDRFYQPVRNNGTRVLEFGFAASAGQKVDPGSLTPQRMTVGTGAWSATTVFTARQTGKVIIKAAAEGLDPAQTVLLVTRPAASLLSQLIEPVAYAAEKGFEIWPDSGLEAQANGNSKASFQLTFSAPPPAGTTVRVRVDPPAVLIYEGKAYGSQTDIALADNKAISENIDVISGTPATVQVTARVLPNGEESRASMRFTAPRPSRVRFCEDITEIISTQHTVPISIELTDDIGNPLQADSEKHIRLSAANEDDPVSFDPASVTFSPSNNLFFSQTMLHLNGLPPSGELTMLAVAEDGGLKVARTTLKIKSPIKGIALIGPLEVPRGSDAEYTVRLTGKDGEPMAADWSRNIKLSAGYGKFIPSEITIPKDQDSVRVSYQSAGTTGKVSLRAESGGLKEGAQDIVLITAVYWLLIAALIGGLIGGAVRHFATPGKSHKNRRVKAAINWRGVIGTLVGSIASGVFLYLAMRLGLSRALGSLALPLDYGTWLVAFFCGGVGGFAGPAVFERLVGLVLSVPAPQPAPGH